MRFLETSNVVPHRPKTLFSVYCIYYYCVHVITNAKERVIAVTSQVYIKALSAAFACAPFGNTSIRVRSIVNRVMAESPWASSSNSSRQRKEYRSLITLRWTCSGPQHIDYPTWSNPIVKRTCLSDMNSLGNWMAVASPTNFPAALTHGKTWPCPKGLHSGQRLSSYFIW